jgi:Ca2+/Na+ antiporter
MRAFWAIEDKPSVVAWAQTRAGKCALLLLAFLLLCTTEAWQEAMFYVIAMGLFAYYPPWRNIVFFVSTYTVAFFFSTASINDAISEVALTEGLVALSPEVLGYIALVVFLFLAWGLMAYARSHKQSLLIRRPVLSLLGLECLLCLLSYKGIFSGHVRLALWSLLCVLTPYFWFLAYALVDQRSKDRSSDLFQLATFHPAWGGPSSSPIGKGAAYLRKVFAKTPEELAITQIKAVKLLVWAKVLSITRMLLTWLCISYLHIPTVSEAMDASLHNHAFSLGMEWASLIWSVIAYSLKVAIYGHFAVGAGRCPNNHQYTPEIRCGVGCISPT